MTDQKDKKGLLGFLLRHGSLAKRIDKPAKEQLRDGDGDGPAPGRRPEHGAVAAAGNKPPHQQRRRTRRPSPAPGSEISRAGGRYSRKTKGVGWEDQLDGRARPARARLTVWPPSGVSSTEDLPPQHAQELISRGTPCHRGHKREIPHAPENFYALYATSTGNRGDRTDTADLHDGMTQLMTMRIHSPGHASTPWETLEQPSFSFFYGHQPGTVTLNQWASMASVLPPAITLRDSGVEPRNMDLERVFERLKELQAGLEDDDEDLLYRILYKRMLKDPDKILSPHRTLDKQITDLILVLSRPGWVDFTNPKNQVVTRFIFDTGEENHEQYHRFFHQLLLSLELELRIQSPQHSKWAKEKLLRQIPPTIQWNLALARRWRENVRVVDWGMTAEEIQLRYKLKKRQVKALKRFAQTMKWPNLAEVLNNLAQRDEESSLDSISSDTFAYFSGLVLPGPTFPFLIMNTLIDLDPDPATDDLALLSHIHPHCGFQYRNSYTYWPASCIVGKVLAPNCSVLAGWVGPARPTADLGRSQIARIRSRRPKQELRAEDVETMAERSDALGPHAEAYPVSEYELVLPDTDDVVDTVRIELLALKAADGSVAPATTKTSSPRLFDATVQFAIDGRSWPLRLMYDVTFVSAWPCSGGPHPLFFDYVYHCVKVDEIVDIRDWGRLYGGQSSAGAGAGAHSARSSPAPGSLRHRDRHGGGYGDDGFGRGHGYGYDGGDYDDEDDDEERVLVVEAFGVRDNEVLARAWCSHWGLSAIVADVRKTCMACAIREAYAATLTVLILVEGTDAADEAEFAP